MSLIFNVVLFVTYIIGLTIKLFLIQFSKSYQIRIGSDKSDKKKIKSDILQSSALIMYMYNDVLSKSHNFEIAYNLQLEMSF